MTTGADFQSFAKTAKVSIQTLYNWRKEYDEFEEAFAYGYALSYAWWEEKSRQLGMGKINTGLFVINMRNRFKWAGKDKPDEPTESGNDDEIYVTWEKNKSER